MSNFHRNLLIDAFNFDDVVTDDFLPRKRAIEAEAEGNINDITRVKWLLSQCTIRNQLPVIKQAVSATIQNLIGYFPENI